MALVLMTYPSRMSTYGRANETIRLTAKMEHVPLIDLARAFEQVCPDEACSDLFQPDQHPNARGYHFLARTIVERFDEAAKGHDPDFEVPEG